MQPVQCLKIYFHKSFSHPSDIYVFKYILLWICQQPTAANCYKLVSSSKNPNQLCLLQSKVHVCARRYLGRNQEVSYRIVCHCKQIKVYYAAEGNCMDTRYIGFLQIVDFAQLLQKFRTAQVSELILSVIQIYRLKSLSRLRIVHYI